MRQLVRWLVVTLVAGFGACAICTGSQAGALAQDPLDGLPAPGEPWDLVYLTNSQGWGVPELYARHAEEALGVNVRVHDLTIANLNAAQILDYLDLSMFADQVADAEIVVVFGDPERSGVELPFPDVRSCWSTVANALRPPATSSAADWAPYREMLGRVFERVWELREERPTVVRTADMFVPMIDAWDQAGVLEECRREWEMMSDQVRVAAEAHGWRMVSIFDALNGPHHDRDLVERGWVHADSEHLNAEGAARLAEALAAVGFEPLTPPD